MRNGLLIACIFYTIGVFSQTASPVKELLPVPKNPTDWSTQMVITDHMGRPFRPDHSEVKGSPFYFDDWKFANARAGSRVLSGIKKIKIDLYNREIDCIGADNDSLIIQDGFIKEFTLLDSPIAIAGKNYLFRSGYPAIHKNNSFTFYEVLAEGAIQLLKASRKELVVNKNDMTGEISKEFVQYDDYYIFRNGEISPFKKDKDFVLGLMRDQQKKIDEYLKNIKMNFKNPEALISLFNYYNSLLQPRAF